MGSCQITSLSWYTAREALTGSALDKGFLTPALTSQMVSPLQVIPATSENTVPSSPVGYFAFSLCLSNPLFSVPPPSQVLAVSGADLSVPSFLSVQM